MNERKQTCECGGSIDWHNANGSSTSVFREGSCIECGASYELRVSEFDSSVVQFVCVDKADNA